MLVCLPAADMAACVSVDDMDDGNGMAILGLDIVTGRRVALGDLPLMRFMNADSLLYVKLWRSCLFLRLWGNVLHFRRGKMGLVPPLKIVAVLEIVAVLMVVTVLVVVRVLSVVGMDGVVAG